MAAGAVSMGRPKRGEQRPPAPPEDTDDRVAIINLKGSRQYADWLDEANKKTHIAKATIVRLAIKDWAKNNGLVPPPEL